MGKSSVIILMLISVLIMSGCSASDKLPENTTATTPETSSTTQTVTEEPGATPKSAVENALDAVKSVDMEGLAGFAEIDGYSLIDGKLVDENGKEIASKLTEDDVNSLKEILKDVQFTVGDIVENGNEATVKLNIENLKIASFVEQYSDNIDKTTLTLIQGFVDKPLSLSINLPMKKNSDELWAIDLSKDTRDKIVQEILSGAVKNIF